MPETSSRIGLFRDRRCLQILLVEDSDADVRLVRTILQQVQPECDLHAVSTAEEALDFLHQRGAFASAPVPDIIILDWHLPRQNGDTLLSAVKSDPALRVIPVIVLSSLGTDPEIMRAYELQASCWIVKGSDFDEEKRRLEALIEFWSRTAQLPGRSDYRIGELRH